MPNSLLETFFMKNIVFVMILSVCMWGDAFGQLTGYRTAAGIRIGNSSGITGKMGLGGKLALEGALTTRWDGVNLTVLAEVANPIADTQGLGWYLGGGAHVGYWDDPEDPEKNNRFFIGVDGIVGMEYTFSDIPLNLSLDWKPMFNILSSTYFAWDEFALSVRYVIN